MERLSRPNRLAGEIVLADGIGSAGKRMLAHILASLERVEKQSHHMAFDYVAQYNWLGRIDDEAAVNYLQIEADYQLYHIMMSRDVNFRPKDATGVLQNPNRLEYFRRLMSQEGDSVVARIDEQKPILQEVPHDGLRNGSLYFKAFGDQVKIVHIVRHPYDIAIDWMRRGFDTRFGTDRREFQITIEDHLGRPVPFFLRDTQIDFYALNMYDRATLLTSVCLIQNYEGYGKLTPEEKSQVHFVYFDSICTSPEQELENLVGFVGTMRTKETKRILKKEGLPRALQVQDRVSFLETVSNLEVRKLAARAMELYANPENLGY
jgi:hypothetical protein